jgi:hypothetical protein
MSSSPATFVTTGCTAPSAISWVSIREAAAHLARRGPRPVAEPYVCIPVRSTTQCKYGTTPHGTGLIWNLIPEEEAGDRPVQERAHWVTHAEFFVGLSSGLSWLARDAGTPVVMISGCTIHQRIRDALSNDQPSRLQFLLE